MPPPASSMNIARENGQRVAAIGVFIEGRDMGSVVADAMAAVKRDVSVPEGNFLAWGGEFENQKRALGRLDASPIGQTSEPAAHQGRRVGHGTHTAPSRV